MRPHVLLNVFALLLTSLPTGAQAPKPAPDKKPDPMSAGTFAGLRLRAVGPAVTSGRVIAFAVDPKDRRRYYVAAASGGVWKTENAGTTWTPVFDNEGSYSIGAIALDPKNPAIVWVGTGECNSQRSVGYGDGVYKSEDGGRSWRNVGLKASEHIGRIAIDPRSTNTVYVAAQGPLWSPGGERGLFKTSDGGKTWKNILSFSENTGVGDVALDPQNPDTLYAAAYQRRRHVWTLIDGGPESAVYKSTDAGATWMKLRSGLPGAEMGRIGLAVSPVNPAVVYATVEAAERQGGIFRSSDYGATWEKRNDFDSTAMYYGQIVCDPKDGDRLYVMNMMIMVSNDGGRTLSALGGFSKHVDNHALWIDPNSTDYYLVGCDGGVYESFDRGAAWNFKANLPITQFYDVEADNALPFYNVYGGTQDNNSLGGPSRTRHSVGITNADWFMTQGGDGFQTRVDPYDPNTVYSTMQYGGVVRFDRRTGERMEIKPQEGKGEKPFRWNWDAPLLISPHSRTRLYFAANVLFRSDDRGSRWKRVSPDLTRALDRDKLPLMGKIWGADAVAKHANTAPYGNISCLAESPKQEGLLYVGTDDGLIQVSEDGGANWRKVETFPGVPDRTYVSRVLASQHAANTVYAAFDNHQNGDFAPYLLKSADAGKTWVSLKGDLPARGSVYAIAEDHGNPNLLFVGTEFGLFFSPNGGGKWIQLKGGLPTIAVRDIAIQRRENDLVVGTFGRGISILDDYTPLRTVSAEMLAKEGALLPVKEALAYLPAGAHPGAQGDSYFTTPNPPVGAVFTYYLKETPKTKKQKRKEAEREAERKKETPPLPTPDDLRAEEEEEPVSVLLTVLDGSGNVVRRLPVAPTAGLYRTLWDLRYPSVSPPQEGAGGGGRGRGGGLFGGGGGMPGPPVLPGRYTVRLSRRANGAWTELARPVEFRVSPEQAGTVTQAARAERVKFLQKVARLQKALLGTMEAANGLTTRLNLIQRAIQETPSAKPSLLDDTLSIEKRLSAILLSLRGDPFQSREGVSEVSIQQQVNGAVFGLWQSSDAPTQTQRDAYAIAAEAFGKALASLRGLIQGDLAKLEKALDAAGAPWTPGRLPEWKEE